MGKEEGGLRGRKRAHFKARIQHFADDNPAMNSPMLRSPQSSSAAAMRHNTGIVEWD
jgi:hypothetical protein